MKKQKIALLLGFCWVIGMSLLFSFPAKADKHEIHSSGKTVVQEITTPDLHLRTSSDNPKTPPFEIDWRLSLKLNSTWVPAFICFSSTYLAPAFFQKSLPLADIFTFFIRYYYTW